MSPQLRSLKRVPLLTPALNEFALELAATSISKIAPLVV